MGRSKSFLIDTFQILFFIVAWLFADWLVRTCALPVPAGVLGLAMIALALFLRILPLHWVDGGARWLLGEMLLFFMPSLMAITEFGDLLMQEGWVLLIVLCLGCLIVMAGTAWVVDAVVKFERARNLRHDLGELH